MMHQDAVNNIDKNLELIDGLGDYEYYGDDADYWQLLLSWIILSHTFYSAQLASNTHLSVIYEHAFSINHFQFGISQL